MASILNRDANITKANSEITEESLFGNRASNAFLMDVSVDGHAELIQELTDASRRKGAYAIREAISNAIDATIKAGSDSPVEVYIPETIDYRSYDASTLAAKLELTGESLSTKYATVTDHGVGMSMETLRENFAQYGSSDKRGSGLIGSKGLGAKAPLACADFFEVESTHGGRTIRMFLWREQGGNYARIVSDRCTGAPSGTTVRIPVLDDTIREEMEETAIQIASWSIDVQVRVTAPGTSYSAHALGRELGRAYDAAIGIRESYGWHSNRRFLTDSKVVYMGRMPIGVTDDGEKVAVDVWRNENGIAKPVNDPAGFPDYASIDINLMGVRYPLLRDGAVGSSLSMSGSSADYIIGCDPGFLNFTISRDDIKEDESWRRFVAAVRDGLAEYDQWPATIAYVGTLDSSLKKMDFLAQHGIHVTEDAGDIMLVQDSQSHALSDGERLECLSVTNDEGEVIDFSASIATSPKNVVPEGSGIRLLMVLHGDMRGMTCKDDGTISEVNGGLSSKAVRGVVNMASRFGNLAGVLGCLSQHNYWARRSLDSITALVLTNVGCDMSRFGTADLSFRKAMVDGDRPSNAAIVYVLCEGDIDLSDGDREILSSWFGKGYEQHDFGEFLATCRKGIARERDERRQAAEKRLKEAAREKDIHYAEVIGLVRSPSWRGACECVNHGNSDRRILDNPAVATEGREPIDFANLRSTDLLAIVDATTATTLNALASAWALLSHANVFDKEYRRIIVLPGADVARQFGVYDQFAGKCDVLVDFGNVVSCVADGRVTMPERGCLSVDIDGLKLGSRQETTAALLLSDKQVLPSGLNQMFELLSETGSDMLDKILCNGKLGTNYARSSYGWGYRNSKAQPHYLSVTTSKSLGAASAHATNVARRMTEVWNSGVCELVCSAKAQRLPKPVTTASVVDGLRALVAV